MTPAIHKTDEVYGFIPLPDDSGKPHGGSYQFAIATAGSTGLLFQTLLPMALAGSGGFTTMVPGDHVPD